MLDQLNLTEEERAALRHGPGFVGVIRFAPRGRGARTRPVRPARTPIYRTAEAARQDCEGRFYRDYVVSRKVFDAKTGEEVTA